MEQSRLVKYIKALSPKEREKFHLFVHSPYFNKHDKTVQLLEVIEKWLERPHTSLDKPVVFKKLFPKEKYDEQRLHNVMSYLKKLYHSFLAFRHFEETPFQGKLCTIEAAYESNQFDLMKNRGKLLEKDLDKHPYKDGHLYYTFYKLNKVMGYYITMYEDRSKPTQLQGMVDSLDRYYILEKLRHSCHILANTMMLNTAYNFHFLKELLEYIKKNWEEYEHDTPIVLYYTIYRSLEQQDNPAAYQRLKYMLANEISLLSKDEQGDLYSFAINYCISRINQGDRDFQRELFQLYKQGLKSGLILDRGILSEWNYKNITALGCSLKEFEWTEDFIQTYKEKLLVERQENAYNYNLAHLYYNKKLYNEALSVLLLVQFTDVKYHLNTTFLLLRTYYALKDTEALLALIETFRIYVMRNKKMTTEQKKGYTNFLRFAKKLVLLKHQAAAYTRSGLHEKLDNLHTKISQTRNVINKFWLLEECRA